VFSIVNLCFLSLLLPGCGEIGGGKPKVADATADCAACHIMDESQGRRSGPNLYGVVGRAAGTQTDFDYSTAMKNSGIVWTPEKLDAFLTAPQSLNPGTRMGYSGNSDAEPQGNHCRVAEREITNCLRLYSDHLPGLSIANAAAAGTRARHVEIVVVGVLCIRCVVYIERKQG
jgi:cytochrome c